MELESLFITESLKVEFKNDAVDETGRLIQNYIQFINIFEKFSLIVLAVPSSVSLFSNLFLSELLFPLFSDSGMYTKWNPIIFCFNILSIFTC